MQHDFEIRKKRESFKEKELFKKFVSIFNRGIFKSVKGKLLGVCVASIGSIILLGIIVLSVLNYNNSQYKITRTINNIKVKQYENETLYVQYSNTLNMSYLYSVRTNLEQMRAVGEVATKLADSDIKDKIRNIQNNIDESINTIDQVMQLSEERGTYKEQGLFQELLKDADDIIAQFDAITNDSYWLDGIVGPNSNYYKGQVQFNEKAYNHFSFQDVLPRKGTRQQLVIRLGGHALDFNRETYITNIAFVKDGEETKIDIKEYLDNGRYWANGALEANVEYVELNNIPGIKIMPIFDASKQMWEEATIYLNIDEINLMDYDSVKYDVYYPGDVYEPLQVGYSFNGKYGFQYAYTEMISMLHSYTQAIGTGDENWQQEDNWIMEQQRAVDAKLVEIEATLPKYVVNINELASYLNIIRGKQEIFNQMKEYDEQILTLRLHISTLEDQLLTDIEAINDTIEANMNNNTVYMTSTIIIILAMVMLVVWTMTQLISNSIRKNIDEFELVLDEMAQGNLTVRMGLESQDEFGQFARALNTFADKLSVVLFNIQELVNEVGLRNSDIAVSIRQITNGDEKSTKGIIQLQQLFNDVTNKTATQCANTEESFASIRGILSDNNQLVEQITGVKEKSSETLSKVRRGEESIHVLTGEINSIYSRVNHAKTEVTELIYKARNIGNSLVTIKDLSIQVGELSDTVCSEENKVKEGEKGLGMVASEIKKLSQQTRQEAEKIDTIINEINNNVIRVQNATKEVEDNIQETVHITNNFEGMMKDIMDFTEINDDNINAVYQVIDRQNFGLQNISQAVEAISEEAIQIAHNTGETMEITNAISDLLIENVEGVEKVMNLSLQLRDDMSYFQFY